MSLPAPLTLKVPFENVAFPAVATDPTSCDAHGAGNAPPPPLAAVTNDQSAPWVLPPLATAVTRQKYVVLGDSPPGEYDGDESPVATCDGGFVVPKATLNVVPVAPLDQVSVGDVLTPVAPLAGLGFVGAAGGVPPPQLFVPDVVNDRTADGALIPLAGVAKVRDTICQKYVVPLHSVGANA